MAPTTAHTNEGRISKDGTQAAALAQTHQVTLMFSQSAKYENHCPEYASFANLIEVSQILVLWPLMWFWLFWKMLKNSWNIEPEVHLNLL